MKKNKIEYHGVIDPEEPCVGFIRELALKANSGEITDDEATHLRLLLIIYFECKELLSETGKKRILGDLENSTPPDPSGALFPA